MMSDGDDASLSVSMPIILSDLDIDASAIASHSETLSLSSSRRTMSASAASKAWGRREAHNGRVSGILYDERRREVGGWELGVQAAAVATAAKRREMCGRRGRYDEGMMMGRRKRRRQPGYR